MWLYERLSSQREEEANTAGRLLSISCCQYAAHARNTGISECLSTGVMLCACDLQVGIVFVWKWHLGGVCHLLLVLLEHGLVDLDFWWCESWGSDEFERLVANQLASEPTVTRVSDATSGGLMKSLLTGRASRSYNWTLPRYRSTEGSSCGGM